MIYKKEKGITKLYYALSIPIAIPLPLPPLLLLLLLLPLLLFIADFDVENGSYLVVAGIEYI